MSKDNNNKVTIAVIGERLALISENFEKRFDKIDNHFERVYDKIDDVEKISQTNKTNLTNHLTHHDVERKNVQWTMNMYAAAVAMIISAVVVMVGWFLK